MGRIVPGSTMLLLCRSACCSAVFAPTQVSLTASKDKLPALPHVQHFHGEQGTLWHDAICVKHAISSSMC